MKRLLLYAAAAAALAVYAIPAKAVTADGITYSLANPDDNNFILSISGINTVGDTEGGRASINAIAFSTVGFNITGGTSAGSFLTGGLNSSGCNGNGGFICFDVNIPVSGSTLSVPFHLDSANLAGWADVTAFKIDWIGSKNNYDLVSKPFGDISGVPIPGAVWLFASGLVGLIGLSRRKRKITA